MQGYQVHPRSIATGEYWPVDLAVLYLKEAIDLDKRRDVAVAQLGKRGQIKANQLVSFAGTFHWGAVSAIWVGAPVQRPCAAVEKHRGAAA